MAIITQIWHRAKLYFTSILLKQLIVPDYCTTYEQNYHILVWDITRNTQNLCKNCHIYSNLAQSQILFYMHQQPMVPDHGTQYKENPFSYHGGMHKDVLTDRLVDGLMDWTRSCIPWFHLSGAGNNKPHLSPHQYKCQHLIFQLPGPYVMAKRSYLYQFEHYIILQLLETLWNGEKIAFIVVLTL